MIRLVLLLVALVLAAVGASWLADRPGEMVIVWEGWRLDTTVPVALTALVLFMVALFLALRLLYAILTSHRTFFSFSRRRRREKGWQALSHGLLAVSAGDARAARKARDEAARYLPHEPLTHLLAAQSAQVDGDRDVAIQSFRVMLEAPHTRLLALRGMHMEARRAGDLAAARTLAEEASTLSPALPWAADAVIAARCAEGDYAGARAVLERQMSAKGLDKAECRRRRAVLLAAEAMALEASDSPTALERALEAVKLAPTLVPAAAVAGRLLGQQGEIKKAAKILAAAYEATPHPDLAQVYAHLRSGDAATDRLKRVRVLAAKVPDHPESRIALAHAAMDAHEFQEARAVLQPLAGEPTQRICLMMAELEASENGDVGKAREWAARALRAPRDPAWIADGQVSEQWAAVSPVTGKLDAYVWEVPPGVTATPVLEHEAERLRAAIAAIPPPAPPIAPVSEGAGETVPAAVEETVPAREETPSAAPATAPSPVKPEPVVAMPPLPDDPGPLRADEDPDPRRPAGL